jgi:hypothetical protein
MERNCQKTTGDLVAENLQKYGIIDGNGNPVPDPLVGFEKYDWKDLLSFDPANDPDCLIGNRWLCRGMTGMIFSGAGKGKSSLREDMAVAWALGRDWHGLKAVRPLRSLILQGENGLGDEAEIVQGIIRSRDLGPADVEVLKVNIQTHRLPSSAGEKFFLGLRQLLACNPVDLVWLDPLFHIAGKELALGGDISGFLREGLESVLRQTNTCAIWMHHTSKPPRDRSKKDDYDFANSFHGSVELLNYCRAAGVLIPSDSEPGVAEFRMVKRERRTGLIDDSGNWTPSIWLKQAEGFIGWTRIPAPSTGDAAPAATSEKLKEYAKARRKYCTSAGILPDESAKKLASHFGVVPRTIYNWEATYKEVVGEHSKYSKKR